MTKLAWIVFPGLFIALASVLVLANVWERSAWWALLFFAVVLILSHVLLYLFKPNTTTLKYIDYVWLTIATIGIIAAGSDWNKIYASLQLQSMREPYKSDVIELKSQVSWARSYLCDTHFEKTKDSPANFDKMVVQQHEACAWIVRIQPAVKKMTEDIDRAPRGIASDVRLLATPPPMSDFAGTVKEVTTMVEALQSEDRTVDRLRATSEDSELGLLLKSLSPYLLAFAIAIRFAKVTGELIATR